LFAIVRAASHQGTVGILQDHDKFPGVMDATLVGPKADKFGL
jgi:hypothetical protein